MPVTAAYTFHETLVKPPRPAIDLLEQTVLDVGWSIRSNPC
jgi:hypothetical protein